MVTQKKRRRDGDARARGTRDECQHLGKTNQQRITSTHMGQPLRGLTCPPISDAKQHAEYQRGRYDDVDPSRITRNQVLYQPSSGDNRHGCDTHRPQLRPIHIATRQQTGEPLNQGRPEVPQHRA